MSIPLHQSVHTRASSHAHTHTHTHAGALLLVQYQAQLVGALRAALRTGVHPDLASAGGALASALMESGVIAGAGRGVRQGGGRFVCGRVWLWGERGAGCGITWICGMNGCGFHTPRSVIVTQQMTCVHTFILSHTYLSGDAQVLRRLMELLTAPLADWQAMQYEQYAEWVTVRFRVGLLHVHAQVWIWFRAVHTWHPGHT